MGTRRPRQGEAFWSEMVAAWKASGVGARRLCREQGLAVAPGVRLLVVLSDPYRHGPGAVKSG